MKFERFEDIVAWQKAQDLTLEIYELTRNIKDYCFVDQIRRAAISVSNNIAEGYERKSNNEFKQFLFIAKGSTGEIRSMLHLAKELKYVPKEKYQYLLELSISISKMLSGLIKTL